MYSAPEAGDALGRYRLLERVGAGGMGVVYRARDERLDRDVALKVLPQGALADAATRRRFRHEALALSKLNHPNVATVHDFDSQGEVDFLVMEWIPGHTLTDSLSHGALPNRDVVSLGLQLAEGLAAAHATGIVHRDLKPGNLRVTPDGRLKILDFGVARLLQPVADLTTTHTGTAVDVGGTLAYMSPEQLSGEAGDRRSDIYAAGAVLYELATGQRLFGETSGLSLIDAIVRREPSAPRTVNPDVLPALEQVILTAIDKNPNRRYQSARELGVALDGVHAAATAAQRPRSRNPWWLLASAVAAVALLAVALWSAGGLGAPPPGARSAPRVRSIAVLPLDNLSRDPSQEYFADGMTEALITDLAKIGALRVISRTSVMRFKGERKPLPEIARALNVDAIVEGSVLRVGERVRITAQLIDASSDEHLWADTYERDLRDVLALQSEVARAIAAEINVTLTPDERRRLAAAPTVNPAAHRAYLEGRYHWNKRTPDALAQAIAFFERAISLQPGYAAAYAGLADCYVVLPGLGHGAVPPVEALPKAWAAGTRAVALDPTNGEAYVSLGYVETFNWNWSAAEAAFKRASELRPNDHTFWRAAYLAARSRHDEAIDEARRGQAADPLSPIASAGLAWMYHLSRQHERALEQSQQTLELDPNFAMGHHRRGWALALTGRYDQAIAAFEAASSGGPVDNQAAIAYTLGRAGRRPQAEEAIRRLEATRRARYVSAFSLAVAHVGLDEKDRAFEWLDRAVDERAWGLIHLGVDPVFDPLRSDARFPALLRRLGVMP